jgi:hypothetical protein
MTLDLMPMPSNPASFMSTNLLAAGPEEALWKLILKIRDVPVTILIMVSPKIRPAVCFSFASKP